MEQEPAQLPSANRPDLKVGHDLDLPPPGIGRCRLSTNEHAALVAAALRARNEAPRGLEETRARTAVLETFDRLMEVRGDVAGWPEASGDHNLES